MTENKRFNLRAGYYDEYTGICGGNNENFTTNEVVDLLNNQDMHIFLLKCVIQTITAESMDKAISHKRIREIKKHWYDKLYGDVE